MVLVLTAHHIMSTVLFIKRKSPILLTDLAMPSLIFLLPKKKVFLQLHDNFMFSFGGKFNLGKPSFKKKRFFMKNFHKMVTPPPPITYCICEILIQIFYRK